MSSCFCVLLLVTVKSDFEFSWLFGILLQSVSGEIENTQQNRKITSSSLLLLHLSLKLEVSKQLKKTKKEEENKVLNIMK